MWNLLITLYVICLIGWLLYLNHQLEKITKENEELKAIKRKYDGVRYWLNRLNKEHE